MYAFQLAMKMFLTFCLCTTASWGKVTFGPWTLAARPPDTHASATIVVRSDLDLIETARGAGGSGDF